MHDLRPAVIIRRHFVLQLLSLFLWGGLLAWLSLAAEVSPRGGIKPWDKFSHFAAYAILAVLLVKTLVSRYPLSLRLLASSWLMCCGYGLLLEVLQWAMALGRQWETGDLLANGLGALAGCVIFCRNLLR